jgi:hypothetical protein
MGNRSATTALLATAVAILCVTVIAWLLLYKSFGPDPDLSIAWLAIAATCPIWSQVAFLAFAVGRKRLTNLMVIFFALAQPVLLGISYWALWEFTKPGGGR